MGLTPKNRARNLCPPFPNVCFWNDDSMKIFWVSCTLSLLLMLSGAAIAADASTDTVISYAEKPIRLIRGTTVFLANAGVVLQKGDILESGPSALQIEITPSLEMAVTPSSKLYIGDVGSKLEVKLVPDWIKMRIATGESIAIQSPLMHVGATGSTLVSHVKDERIELFPKEAY
jgi:hypothetical protein